MHDFNEISIKDKGLFDSYFRMYNPQTSELTFSNLFMWRHYYKFRYAEINGYLCLISISNNGIPFAFAPVGEYHKDSFSKTVTDLKKQFEGNGWELRFKRIPGEVLQYFMDFTLSEDDIVLDEDNSDYVYLSSDLVYLKGKKYDGKRNHINKFKKVYEYEYAVLDETNIDDACRIVDDWCAERDCEQHRGFYCEKLANTELIRNYKELGCTGALIKVNGRFEGVTVGEMLNSDTAVIHIEKASSSVNGLYTFINQQFCENEWKDAEYINREQDLGIEGLRKAKLSYHPVKMIKKYSVKI